MMVDADKWFKAQREGTSREPGKEFGKEPVKSVARSPWDLHPAYREYWSAGLPSKTFTARDVDAYFQGCKKATLWGRAYDLTQEESVGEAKAFLTKVLLDLGLKMEGEG